MKNLYKKLAALLMIFGVAAMMSAQNMLMTLTDTTADPQKDYTIEMVKTGEKDGKPLYEFNGQVDDYTFMFMQMGWDGQENAWAFGGIAVPPSGSFNVIAFVSTENTPYPPTDGAMWQTAAGGFVVKKGVNLGVSKASEVRAEIYPNPVKDVLFVHTAEKAAEVQLFTMDGKAVKSQKTSDGKAQLNVSGLSKGVYLLKVKTASGVSTKKIVKQ